MFPNCTIRIARATSYLFTFIVGQAMATSSAAQRSLNRPRLKEEVRPIFAPARLEMLATIRLWRPIAQRRLLQMPCARMQTVGA